MAIVIPGSVVGLIPFHLLFGGLFVSDLQVCDERLIQFYLFFVDIVVFDAHLCGEGLIQFYLPSGDLFVHGYDEGLIQFYLLFGDFSFLVVCLTIVRLWILIDCNETDERISFSKINFVWARIEAIWAS